jgi:hypothetical protein
MPITLSELEDAYDWANTGPYGEVEVWIDRRSGRVYVRSDYVDPKDEPLPDDIEDDDRYLGLPDKRDLDLGKPLAIAFSERFMERDYQDVRDIFSRRGAYGRFKALLERRGVLDQWYAFETEATREALKTWAADNDLAIADEGSRSPPLAPSRGRR